MPKTEKNTLMNEADDTTSRGPRKPMLPWILVLLVLLGSGIFFAVQYRKMQDLSKQVSDLKSDPQKAAQDQTKDLIDKVGKLIVLPNETPTVATVTDLNALKDQPFFATAEVGDKVLIYTQAKKAILYSEKLNKIKEVAPVNLGDAASGTTTDTSATAKAKTSNTNTNTNTNKQSATNSNQ